MEKLKATRLIQKSPTPQWQVPVRVKWVKSQTKKCKRVRTSTLSSKWDICITSLSSKLGDPPGRRRRKAVGVRENEHPQKTSICQTWTLVAYIKPRQTQIPSWMGRGSWSPSPNWGAVGSWWLLGSHCLHCCVPWEAAHLHRRAYTLVLTEIMKWTP